ncbi:amidoligase family protein [Ruthenibacterium lactatiformans]|uniref:amidoligase family protein n=1 Tax=Ruthenibacterium lactatiformans TaxID=1550024 RepID=UPI0029435607|nr:amidoligase family protein [Ruthenibacterium lactatiformans]
MFTMNWRRWTRLDLKDQYFGCEIEMTGITREQAAQAVAALFGTTARQTHESHTYDPWEVTDGVGKKWRFVYDGSIETTRRECGRQAAAHDRRYSVEMNSPKLEYSEMKKLQEVIRALRHAGAVVNESCGMHVHVDASGHTPRSLRNALSIMYSKEDILFRAIGAKPDRISQYCQYSRENVVRTVADLACTLLSILFAALVWLRGKKDGGEDADNENEQAERMDKEAEEDEPRGHAVQKTVNAVLAVLSVVLFFLTQPLVWRFRLVDWWTVLFVLLCGTALAMLIWKRKEENKAEETDEEETEDFAE